MLIQKDTSSTFVNNMSLPVHRWFRYSAGFSAECAEQTIDDYRTSKAGSEITVLDPFAGSGTTLLVCDKLGIRSVGYEAQPFAAGLQRQSCCEGQMWLSFAEEPVKCWRQQNNVTENCIHTRH